MKKLRYGVSSAGVWIGWPHGREFCVHWYIARRGIGAELGEIVPGESVLLVDYDALMNTVDILVAGSHRHKHGRG